MMQELKSSLSKVYKSQTRVLIPATNTRIFLKILFTVKPGQAYPSKFH